jgi:predicted RNase H-like HicB family nuclease
LKCTEKEVIGKGWQFGDTPMVTYRAMYKFLDDGVHAEVLDFPGVISCGRDLDDARLMLRSALVDMAETSLMLGEPLPKPNPLVTDPDADIEEPIHLLLTAASRVQQIPQDVAL